MKNTPEILRHILPVLDIDYVHVWSSDSEMWYVDFARDYIVKWWDSKSLGGSPETPVNTFISYY